jgi:hypothetical protein
MALVQSCIDFVFFLYYSNKTRIGYSKSLYRSVAAFYRIFLQISLSIVNLSLLSMLRKSNVFVVEAIKKHSFDFDGVCYILHDYEQTTYN